MVLLDIGPRKPCSRSRADPAVGCSPNWNDLVIDEVIIVAGSMSIKFLSETFRRDGPAPVPFANESEGLVALMESLADRKDLSGCRVVLRLQIDQGGTFSLTVAFLRPD